MRKEERLFDCDFVSVSSTFENRKMSRCQNHKAKLENSNQEDFSKKNELADEVVRVVVDKSDKLVVVNVRADHVQVGQNNTMIVNLPNCRNCSILGQGEKVESDMAAIASSRIEYKRPVLRLTKVPDQPIHVGRLSWNGFWNKDDHVFALQVDNYNFHTEKQESYVISPSVTRCEHNVNEGSEESKESVANFQVEQLKSDVKGDTVFVFRFHDRPAKLSVKFKLEALSACKSWENKREVLDELAIEINTVKRKTKRKKRDKQREMRDNYYTCHGSSGSDVCEKENISQQSRVLAPAAVTKESQKLSRISDKILEELHRERDNGCWDKFNACAHKLSVKYPDNDSQIAIKLERSEAACYQGDLDKAAGMIDEVLHTLKTPGSALNANLLTGRAYHKRSGVYRRQKKLGAAESCVQLGNQALQTVGVNQDSSFLAYEEATVMLLFMADQPERSPAQVLRAKRALERCIDIRTKLRQQQDSLYVKDLQFVYIKIALLLLDCNSTAGRQRAVPEGYILEAKSHLDTLELKYDKYMTEGARIQLLMVRSDQFFRMQNYILAEERAEEALSFAQEKGFGAETTLIRDRLDAIRDQLRLMVRSKIAQGVEGQSETCESSDIDLSLGTSSSVNTGMEPDFESQDE